MFNNIVVSWNSSTVYPNSFITKIVLQTNSITLQGMHHYNDVLETFGRQMPKALVMPIIQAKKKTKKNSSESKLVQTYPSNSRPSAAKSLSLIKGKQLKELLYFTTNQSIPFFYKHSSNITYTNVVSNTWSMMRILEEIFFFGGRLFHGFKCLTFLIALLVNIIFFGSWIEWDFFTTGISVDQT